MLVVRAAQSIIVRRTRHGNQIIPFISLLAGE